MALLAVLPDCSRSCRMRVLSQRRAAADSGADPDFRPAGPGCAPVQLLPAAQLRRLASPGLRLGELQLDRLVATFSVSALWAVRRYTPLDFLWTDFSDRFWLLFSPCPCSTHCARPSQARLFDTHASVSRSAAAFGSRPALHRGSNSRSASAVAGRDVPRCLDGLCAGARLRSSC